MGSALTRAGSTRTWRKVRADVLSRDRWVCRYCGAPATCVDHVISRKVWAQGGGGGRAYAGGVDDPRNLVAACTRCNLDKRRLDGVFLRIGPAGHHRPVSSLSPNRKKPGGTGGNGEYIELLGINEGRRSGIGFDVAGPLGPVTR